MCSIEISKQTDPEWKLIIGANRDEMKDRKPLRPGSWWVTKILLSHFISLGFVYIIEAHFYYLCVKTEIRCKLVSY